jgi:hypothetical protein
MKCLSSFTSFLGLMLSLNHYSLILFYFPITGNVGYQKKFITIDLQVININIKIIHTIINFKLFKKFLS